MHLGTVFTCYSDFAMITCTYRRRVRREPEDDDQLGDAGLSLHGGLCQDGTGSISFFFLTNGLNVAFRAGINAGIGAYISITAPVFLHRMLDPCFPLSSFCFLTSDTSRLLPAAFFSGHCFFLYIRSPFNTLPCSNRARGSILPHPEFWPTSQS